MTNAVAKRPSGSNVHATYGTEFEIAGQSRCNRMSVHRKANTAFPTPIAVTMAIRVLAGLSVLALFPCASYPQSSNDSPPAGAPPAAAARFAAADVEKSPYMAQPWLDGPHLEGDRYVVYEATLADLIANAYHVDVANVQGGPSWLDFDRYDIDAKTVPETKDAGQRLMLRALLAERFGLAVHNGTAPMPAYVLLVEKDKPKMKPSDASGDSRCDWVQQPPGSPPQMAFSCHNETMVQLAQFLRDTGGGGYLNEQDPVVDGTEVKGAFDFDLKWTPNGARARVGADSVTIFDALDAQLGLKLELETAPRPVLLVDSVNEVPSPDPPGTDRLLPPVPLPEFEVSTVKPYKQGDPRTGQFGRGSLNVSGLTLRDLITVTWDLNENNRQVIANEPAWLDKDRWNIVAKWSIGDANIVPSGDFRQFQHMMKALLADRFGMKAHMEDRIGDAYDLVAVSPKMTPADPTTRTRCTEGPGPDGKDPRIANPALNRLLTCQNVTMTELGDLLQSLAPGYIYGTVLDKTALKGSYNFTLSFSAVGQLAGNGNPPPSAQKAPDGSATSEASDPNGAVSLFDAVRRELGLKLEKVRRPVPVLVIDHIDENPTPN